MSRRYVACVCGCGAHFWRGPTSRATLAPACRLKARKQQFAAMNRLQAMGRDGLDVALLFARKPDRRGARAVCDPASRVTALIRRGVRLLNQSQPDEER